MPTNQALEALHAIVADLDYPMAIVTTSHGAEQAGCLVGFVTQCSMDPPLLMVWLSKLNRTTRVAQEASSLLVHFLSRTERELAALFGSQTGDEVDKFAGCRWEPGPEGLPRLTDCTRWVAGHVLERIGTGDHIGHLIDPFDAGAGGWTGQLGFQLVKDVEPGHPA